jgi:Bacterial Ig-like domain (group 3)
MITGTPEQGQTLTANHGSWTGDPTSFTDRWLRCDADGTHCTQITDAAGPVAGPTYTLTAADVGHTIVVREVARNADGPSASSDSPPTAVVTAPVVGLSAASPPTISGTPEAGQTLTEDHAGWTTPPTSFSYQWSRCDSSGAACAPVGTDSQTYTLTAADAGHTIVVQEQATGALPGQTGSATSAPTPTIVIRTTTGLVATSTTPVVNQRISLIAVITSTVSGASPAGTVTFSNAGRPLAGCANEPVSSMGQTATAACDVSFAASAPALTAAFTPSAGSFMTSSQSPTSTIAVGRDATSTAIDVSKTTLVGQSTTYTATVAPPASRPGPVMPGGGVEFYDSGQPIAACMNQPLVRGGATCTVTYRQPGTHTIKAVYRGDANFSGSSSATQSTQVQRPAPKVRGTITSTMQWTFRFTRSTTTVSALVVNGALHTTVSVQCHGSGCPFTKQSTAVTSTRPCHQGTRRTCPTHGTLDLTPKFRNRRLSAGARFTVTIARPSWIGKSYTFTVQRGKAPRVRIACLAPGATRPGVGC